ncbi:2-dehydropantoate 2-reductase [Paraburkholderia sp. BL10I2N1]|uniref:2-dehydropantoate 2-reductase n=1 Tax=Paraburkholderia sp. BL10I2N1 TaxID=1938796 RepID=UPI00105EE722|nr:2-dehydropantoate 2-reductase [Paraburkholderia sp. BL10I2N1]TDN70193.1 ketopantoate reductase [Paraburkholderia sp. BL10I2N1]
MGGQQIRTAVVGAGAIGGLIAAAAVRAGHAVSVLAHGKTLDALRADGIRIVGEESETVARVVADDDAATFGLQDFVVVALKAQVLPAVAASLRPMIGPQTVIVAAMNGLPWWFLSGMQGPLAGQHIEAVDPDGRVSAALPPAQSIGCVVHLSSSTDAPGVIRRGRGNHLIVGAPAPALSAQANAFSTALREGGFEVAVSDDIRTEIWVKLWGNMNMNPLSALTGSTADQLLEDPLTHALVLRMMEEADAIGRRLGLSTRMEAAERVAGTRKLGAFKTSMLQDFEDGRPLEIGPILGVFPELGHRLGVPTPFCDAVLGLLRQRASNSGL